VTQVRQLVLEGTVTATDGTVVPLAADTVCLHGDGPQAVFLANRLRTELKKAMIGFKAPEA
jgi:UPF0271 protein